MSAKPYKVALLQMKYPGTPQASLDKACAMLEEAARQGAQVACLPELFLTDYFCQQINPDIFSLAEPVDGKTTQALVAVAKKTGLVIIGSIFEKASAGLHYNTAIILEGDGIKGVYRKMHIPHDPLFEEKYYFAPGDLGFRAFDTGVGRLGALVCWDQWYPEAARLTALKGAEILFYPTAIGWHPGEKAESGEAQVSAWETMQRSHAIANGVYVAAVNRIGHEGPADGGLEFWGRSFICDPFGRMLAAGGFDKEEILTAVVDPSLIEQTRRNWPFLRDRRIDMYGDITKRWGT